MLSRRSIFSAAGALAAAPGPSEGREQGDGDGSTRTEAPLFVDLQRTEIPAAVDRICTRGYGIPGVGGALYAATERTGTTSYRIESANGRWFELAEPYPTLSQFGATGDGRTDDTVAIQDACDYMGARNAPLRVPRGEYRLTSEIICGGSYFRLLADFGAVFRRDPTTTGFLAVSMTPDLSYPTASSAGPMRGAGLYFTSLIYHTLIEGLTFSGFRFGAAFYEPHNSPVFRECIFDQCNIGVFFYQGCQNVRYLNCSTQTRTGTLHASSATCFPADHPLRGADNYYSDGFHLANEGGYGSLLHEVNDAFDEWFVASILRPAVPSYTVAHQGCIYPHSSSAEESRPSGRAVYMPFRNPRVCWGAQFENVDMRGPSFRGVALINSAISDFQVRTLNAESVFAKAPAAFDNVAWFTLGAVTSSQISSFNLGELGLPTASRRVARFTGRGAISGIFGFEERLLMTGAAFQQEDGKRYLALTNGFGRADKFHLNATLQTADTYDDRPGGAVTRTADPFGQGLVFGDHAVVSTENYVDGGSPIMFDLPFQCGDGLWRGRAHLQMAGYDFTGFVRIAAFNASDGDWDFGEFYVQTGAPERLYLIVPAYPGDRHLTLAEAPRPFSRLAAFELAGVRVSAEGYDVSERRLRLVTPLTSLKAIVPAGTVLSREPFCRTARDFRRDWVRFSLGGGLVPPTEMTIASTLAEPNGRALPAQIIRTFATFHSQAFNETAFPSEGAPTQGRWQHGAIVYTNRPSPRGYIGYVCVEGGEPGVWKGFGLIEA